MKMIERVAEAIARQMAEDENDNIDLARAALQAIREPDDAMLRSGMAEGWCDADMAQTTHRAMIDAILNEQ